MGEWKTTKTADGSEMQIYFVRPKNLTKNPAGIIVFQEIFGVNPHIREVTERFAELGLVAIAPDLFHRERQRFESNYVDMEKPREISKKYTAAHMAEDIKASYEWLTNDIGSENIAATGYCLGGKVSFLANALFPLKAAISYYGMIPSLIEQAANQHGPLLMFWGGKDKHLGRDAPRKSAVALDKAEKVYTNVVLSEADHGFNCDQRSSYNPAAAELAWSLTQRFVRQNLQLLT